jgi:hypothetical protein
MVNDLVKFGPEGLRHVCHGNSKYVAFLAEHLRRQKHSTARNGSQLTALSKDFGFSDWHHVDFLPSNDAVFRPRLRLIATSGVLFAVLKCRSQQKRQRPPPVQKFRLSFDTALYPHKYKILHFQMNRDEQRTGKIHTARPAGLRNGGALVHAMTIKIIFLFTVLLLFALYKTRYW